MSRFDSIRLVGPLERALFLRSLGPYQLLSPSEVGAFAENAIERSFGRGTPIFRPGTRPASYHVIAEGSVRARGGEYVEESLLPARSPLGFLTMLARFQNGLEAFAEEDTLTLEFEEDVFHDILEDNFSILHSLIQRLAKETLAIRQQIPSGSYLAPLEGFFEAPSRMLDLVERIVILRRPGSPFGDASLEAISQLAQQTPEVRFSAGDTLWNSGDRPEYALIVIAGSVECTLQWGVSRFRAGPGYPLGNLERLSGDPRWFTAVAETPVVALRSDTEMFFDILEDHFDMALNFVESMARRLIEIRGERPLSS